MKHSGGLDGLRGVAVLVVVLFHAQVPGAGGGFLGVSLFFTLSGFLITSLLLAEFEANDTISLRHFYVRRARRLLPAAYLCLLLVALAGVWWSAGQRAQLPGDLIASLANVANWRFAFAATNYADLFVDAPSPVAHFWSLAIEEQIYLVLPVVVIVALRRGRGTLAWVIGALLSASIAATLLTSDRDLVYNATHTRAAELLVGVALALFVRRGGRAVGDRMWRRFGWVPGAFAGAAFVALVALASIDQEWIYRGGLVAVAVLSAVLIAAVVSEQFPNRLLDVQPLVTIGRLSYGIYLAHWPIFLLLDAERTGLGPVALFALRCVVTGAVAVASSSLLEQPVRQGRWYATAPGFASATGVGAVAVIVATVLVPPPNFTRTEQLLEFGDAGVVDFRTLDRLPEVQEGSAAPTSSAIDAGPTGVPDPFRVAVIGSESSAVEAVRSTVMTSDDQLIEVIDDIRPQCPLSAMSLPGCDALVDRFRSLTSSTGAGAGRIDLLVVATGVAEDAEIAPRSGATESREQLAAFAASQIESSAAIRSAIDSAIAAGAQVMLYSAGQRYGAFDDQLVHLAIGGAITGHVIRTGTELSSAIGKSARTDRAGSAENTSEGSPLRVLVIGDSTSLSLAMGLNDGGDGRVEVLWAGANGCPLAPVEATRPSRGDEWTDHDCVPYEQRLGPVLTSFAPDAVLIVSGPTELTEHRFPGDPAGHIAVDPTFVAARDRTLDEVAAIANGIPLLVADVPAIRPGQFATSEMTDPGRLDALNAQIEQWDLRSTQIAVFPYRGVLEAAEQRHGDLRSDGVHPDAAPLESLSRAVYVDLLIEMTTRMRTELAATRSTGG